MKDPMPAYAYVVCHSQGDGMVLSPSMREMLIGTGNGVDVVECGTYSFQAEYIKRITRRPLYVVLWGMSDRYELAQALGVEIFEVSDLGSAESYCRHQRPHEEERVYEDGYRAKVTVWEWLTEVQA